MNLRDKFGLNEQQQHAGWQIARGALHRELARMGFDKDERDAIFEIVLNAQIITGGAFGLDSVDLGRFLMRESVVPLPRQSWRVRLKFWLQRMWRRVTRCQQ